MSGGQPVRMSDLEMWEFLVEAVDGNHRWLKPVDPGFNATGYLTENDPKFSMRTDAGLDIQRMDSQLAWRSGVQFGMGVFDYGTDPGGIRADFFNFGPQDGGDLVQVCDVLLADGTRSRGAADFYTRDGGSPDGVWFVAQDCRTPGWVHWLNDVDAIERQINIRGPGAPQIGGLALNPTCQGDTGGWEVTTYQRCWLDIPYWVDGNLQPPRLFDSIVSKHWNMGPGDAGPHELFVFVRGIGRTIWREYDGPSQSAWDRNAALFASGRAPFIGGLSGMQGAVMTDCRHGMRFWSLPDGAHHGRDFAWPPQQLVPPS